MESTLDKLFQIFDDIKRQNIFSICIQQIVEIHNQCPSSIQYILKKTIKLLYSVCQDKILQLEHRQIAAGIIEKTFKEYCKKISDFMYSFEQNQSQYSHLFAFEFSEKLESNEIPQDIIIKDLKQARKCLVINLNQIDFDFLFQNSEHLLGKNMSDIYTTSDIEQKKNEEEILEQLGISNSLTEGNLEMVLLSISGDFLKIIPANHKQDEDQEQDKKKKNKRKRNDQQEETDIIKKKVKIENLSEEIIQQDLIKKFVKVFNPFNIVYQKCLKNLLNSNWELRHASALVLRGFIKSNIFFLGFEFQTDSKINNLDIFTKDIIKNQLLNYYQNESNLRCKLQDLISRNLLIVALDRFADFLTDKANIIVRETSSQILSQIFSSEQYRSYLNNEDLQQLFQLLEQFFKQKDWEVKQSSLFLLKQIIKMRPDKHKQIFTQFNVYFLQFIDFSQIDEVILISAECLTELISLYKNNKQYLNQLQNNICETISKLDDITYAIKTLISLLNQLIQIQIKLDSNIVNNIIKLFYHKISDVRYECYIFYDSILDQINNSSYSYDQLLQLYIHSQQAVIIEEHAPNFLSSYKMSLKSFQLLNQNDRISQVQKLITYSLSQEFPSEIIQNFDFIANGYEQNENPYTFYIVLENQQQLKEFYYLRMFKLSKYVAEISSQFKYVQDIQYILKQQLNYTDHRHILNILTILINLEMIIKNDQSFNLVDYLVDGSILESLLQLEFYDINSEELSLIDKQILTLFSKNQSLEIQNFSKITDYKERRKKYENILKNSAEDQSLQNLASYIQDFVNKSFEIIIMIRSQAACLLIQINQRKYKKAPDRLNLVIKPLISQISQEYFYFQSQACSSSLFLLAKNMKFSQPCQKMIKNLMISVQDKSNKSHKKNINFKDDRFQYITFTERFSIKYEGINIFFSLIINEFRQKSFQKISFIQQTFEELTQKLNYTANLRIIKTLIPSLYNLYIDNDLINILSKQMQEQNSPQDQIMQQKIYQRLLVQFLLMEFKNSLIIILENFYSLFKSKVESAYIILENILDNHLKQFIPYGPIFVLQIVKSLTNSNQIIQQKSFLILGNLITALFLQIDNSAQNNLSSKLLKKQKKGIQFILDFKNPKNFEYIIQENPSITLREYQKEGIKWLGFLIKYNLNGALCDDMGLGKTIQTLTVIQNEIINSKIKLPTLILCPTILQEHWNFEIQKFMDKKIMTVHIIQNNIKPEYYLKKNDILIVSYNQILKMKELLKIKFRFCILDEGHLIKNPKSQISILVKQIQADHKFILSGTPIQNNLKELWSLFDFLMPNYLGSEDIFKKNFSKLFNTSLMQFSNDSLVFTDEQNTVLQDLHKRVMPFIMRRKKQDVLQELPQKIIQDYYCFMSNIQNKLYKELEDNEIKQCQNQIQKFISHEKNELNENVICPNILQVIQNMIKLVNHPMMLVDQNKQNNYQTYLKNIHQEINQYHTSGKFNSFRQLLIDLGFEPYPLNQEKETQEKQQQFLENNLQSQTNQSKILVFSRYKQTLNLLISLLIEKEFNYISYLKLDGDVPMNQRFAMVRKFNEIPIYKILFLTTQIGGLGLNLSSANIVVMFDHNFNPQNDLQAMDRAHRIGQKNVVNVYRLITKDTLEEKIMGIQTFKLNIANTIINIDNASIKNIEESNIVGLIDNMIGQEQLQKLKDHDEDDLEAKVNPYKKLLSGMQKELWEEQEYNKEY